MLRKIPILWKKSSSKSFLELNFLQKSHQVHMSISPQSGDRRLERLIWLKYYNLQKQVHMSISPQSKDRRLERLIWLKYYNLQKRQIIFTLGLNAAKNTDCMKKASSKSCLELNSLQKSHWLHMSISSWSRARWLKRYYNVEKGGK